MKIINQLVNKIANPLGFQLDKVVLSWTVIDTRSTSQKLARVEVATDAFFQNVIIDSGWRSDISSIAYVLDITLYPRIRYFWRVSIETDIGEKCSSDIAWFETSKMDEKWRAQWIKPKNMDTEAPVFVKKIEVSEKSIESVRAYISGVGLYELYINTEKVGSEFLTPGCNAYDNWIQYQTYDIPNICPGENEIRVLLGNGWYKGRFGFNHGGKTEHYGSEFELIGEIIIRYFDGSEDVIVTDETWLVSDSHVDENNIYDGEIHDANKTEHLCKVDLSAQFLTERLVARKGLPIVIQEQIRPVEQFHLKDGSVILDYGQNIVGWVVFPVAEKSLEVIHLQYAEIMQDGDIYTKNLRTAKAQFTYIPNGDEEQLVRPHFTFYGFRYVKVSGVYDRDILNNFIACFVYSDIQPLTTLKTSNQRVNKFVDNVVRSQKDNFVDIPTDCPQRDERMGWTGDIQVFSSAACSSMGVYAFLTKYLYDLSVEQSKMKGAVPFVVPMFDVLEAGSSAWGDAATVIPWNMWLHYGDNTILEQQFNSMRAWVDYIDGQVIAQESPEYLWDSGFHFGDWLAPDNEPHIKTFKGKTEDKFIASVYFHYSSLLVSKSAHVLGFDIIEKRYREMSKKILLELRNEYITANGKLALETQTAYILAIAFDIYPQRFMSRAAKDVEAKLARDQFKIKTGFVGTPYFCRALTKVGLNDLAYRIFLSEDKPGWLYPVTQGATTIWERWDSVNEGIIHPDSSMNSLNHYAFGSVIDWLYKDVCGFNPDETQPGFRKAIIRPAPNYRLKAVNLDSETSAGRYVINSVVTDDGAIDIQITVPFDCVAEIHLPDIDDLDSVDYEGELLSHLQQKNVLIIQVQSGEFRFTYRPTKDYIIRYNTNMPIRELLRHCEVKAVLDRFIPDVLALPFLEMLDNESLVSLSKKPFYKYEENILHAINKEISSIVVN